jgi:hypothetical protein
MALADLSNGTVLITCLLVKGSPNWKLATATATLIVSSAIIDHSSLTALEQAFRRTAEVILGSITAVLMSELFFGVFPRPGIFLEATRNNRLESPKRTTRCAQSHLSAPHRLEIRYGDNRVARAVRRLSFGAVSGFQGLTEKSDVSIRST